MISKPLFRFGDCVTVRDDLSTNKQYVMLHDTTVKDTVTANMVRAGSRRQCIGARLPSDRYCCDGFHETWTDGMFVEGRRIMEYLNMASDIEYESPERLIFLDDLCNDWYPYRRSPFSDAEYVTTTRDTGDWVNYSYTIDDDSSAVGSWVLRSGSGWDDVTF